MARAPGLSTSKLTHRFFLSHAVPATHVNRRSSPASRDEDEADEGFEDIDKTSSLQPAALHCWSSGLAAPEGGRCSCPLCVRTDEEGVLDTPC